MYRGIYCTEMHGYICFTKIYGDIYCTETGAPNDRFLSNAFRCCFRLSGVLLKLCRLILACTKKTFICSDILGELEYSRIF